MKRSNYLMNHLKWGAISLPLLFATGGGLSAGTVTWLGGTSTDWTDDSNWSPAAEPADGDDTQIGVVTTVTNATLDLNAVSSFDLAGSSPAAPTGTGLSGTDIAALHFGDVGGATTYNVESGTIRMGTGHALLWIEDGLTVNWNVSSAAATAGSEARFWQVGGGSTLNIGPGVTHNSRFAVFNGGASGSTATVNIDAADFDNGQPWLIGSGNGSTASSSRVSKNITVNVNADQTRTGVTQVGYTFANNHSSKLVIRNGATFSSSGTVAVGEAGIGGTPVSPAGVLRVGDSTTAGTLNITATGNRLRLGTGKGSNASEGALDIINGTVSLSFAESTKLAYAGGAPNSRGVIRVRADGVLNTRSNFVLQTGAVAGSGVINFDGGTLKVDNGSAPAQRTVLIDPAVVVNIEDGGMVFNANNKPDTVIDAALLNAGTGGLQVRDLVNLGNGKLTINGVNTYVGLTRVRDSATLVLGPSASIADSSGVQISTNASFDATAAGGFTVGSAQTLSGDGAVLGALTVDGIVDPGIGSGMGSLTTDSNATWNGTVANAWQFGLGPGDISDTLALGGDFLKGTGVPGTDFVFDFGGSTEAGTFVLVTWTGTTTFSAADFSHVNLGAGSTGTFAINGTQLEFTVTAGSAYDTWAASKGLAGPDADPDADPDGDGLENSLEFVLCGEPNPANPGANSAGLQPSGSESGGDLVFTFERKDISEGAATVTFQWSTDLGFPALNDVPVGATSSVTDGVTVDVTEDSPDVDTDTIVITVPADKAADGKLFGRLKVSVP